MDMKLMSHLLHMNLSQIMEILILSIYVPDMSVEQLYQQQIAIWWQQNQQFGAA
jgi:hypothetical protein